MAVNYDSAIEALETAMASGTLEVEYDGKRVKYSSQTELLAKLSYFRSQKRAQAGVPAVGVSIGAVYRS
ncbi:hypothetical protein KO516_18305 [Citreicella sp. C3M06]|uniref:phage head-tail joining protein n=1 Tax=Citreicella sp. C3M06 TaxID=2841564 RepID=UPI001C080963|nr:hypothetical protein [Citreicella sp. C3M06]MBU2962744.1 hypothetical protein [Citreicella sp. C3M06]